MSQKREEKDHLMKSTAHMPKNEKFNRLNLAYAATDFSTRVEYDNVYVVKFPLICLKMKEERLILTEKKSYV